MNIGHAFPYHQTKLLLIVDLLTNRRRKCLQCLYKTRCPYSCWCSMSFQQKCQHACSPFFSKSTRLDKPYRHLIIVTLTSNDARAIDDIQHVVLSLKESWLRHILQGYSLLLVEVEVMLDLERPCSSKAAVNTLGEDLGQFLYHTTYLHEASLTTQSPGEVKFMG